MGIYADLAAKDRPEHPWWHPLAEPPPKEKRAKRAKAPNKVQTLIFVKKDFNKSGARKWAKSHGFKSSGVDETATSYRIRQRDPSEFVRGSLKRMQVMKGVKAIFGRLKKG